ncbi:MAG: SdpI family protein, partial [Anaerotignum sp.]|nr:SdpI family protein [Anaerotignum sp.]
QKNYEKFRETYDWIMILTLGFMTAIIAVILVETMQPGTMDISKVICIMVGGLFIVLGSMMAKIKQNFFTGIKTPWTLSSEAVWDKTQKLGGKCLVLGGILIMGSALLSSGEAAVFMIILVAVLVTVAPLVMSYIWYRKEMEK